MQNSQNLDQEEVLDIRSLLLRILSNWYWFALFGFVGLGIGYVLTKFSTAQYEISTTLLISEESNKSSSDFLFKEMGLGPTTNSLDQLGIISSYMINNETIEQLDWKTSWYVQDFFKRNDIYKSSPFSIVKLEGEKNLTRIPIYIEHLTEQTYKMEVDDIYYAYSGQEIPINFEQQGKYGEVFSNEYFNFIVNIVWTPPQDEHRKFYFVFNDYIDLTNNYRAKLEINLSDEKSNLIEVKIKESNPIRGVEYLNKLSKVYIQFGLNEKNRASENTVNFIDSQISGIVDSLRQAGQDFTNFRTQNRVVDLSQEAGLVMDRMQELESNQSLAAMRLDYYNNLQQYLGDAKQMEKMVAPSVVGITDPSLNAMVLRLGELYSRRNMLELTVQEKNPSLIALDNEISYTRKSLDENLKNLISNAEVEILNLDHSKANINAQLSRLPKTEQNMVNIKRSFDLNNELYTFLLQKRAEAAIAKASTTPDVKALDIARVENAIRVDSQKRIMLLLGLIVGLAIPAIFMFVSDLLNNKISSKEDIDKVIKLPFLGLIANNKLKTEFPVLKNPNSGITECFRTVRTNLHYMLPKNQSNIIAIQSMISGEGKSFVALNLALAFAINDRSVLLVDGDLRKPQLHYAFKQNNDIGLSTYLMGNSKFDEVVHESKIKNLSVVTTGVLLRNSAELLDSDRLREFLENAKLKFNYIIFTNSPISIVTDGVLIGSRADANVIVLRQNFSFKRDLRLINEFSDQGAIKNISLIFNGVKIDGLGYYANGRGGGYGYFNDTNRKNKNKWKFKPSKETIS
jgi:capsular exopolysaccharide synthesis family protein